MKDPNSAASFHLQIIGLYCLLPFVYLYELLTMLLTSFLRFFSAVFGWTGGSISDRGKYVEDTYSDLGGFKRTEFLRKKIEEIRARIEAL
jgi:hypothetical protein